MSTVCNNDLNASSVLFGVGLTTSQNSADLLNPYGRGVKVFCNMSAIGTGSVTFTIQAKDPASGAYAALLASAAIVAIC